jgi:hypothetical protein
MRPDWFDALQAHLCTASPGRHLRGARGGRASFVHQVRPGDRRAARAIARPVRIGAPRRRPTPHLLRREPPHYRARGIAWTLPRCGRLVTLNQNFTRQIIAPVSPRLAVSAALISGDREPLKIRMNRCGTGHFWAARFKMGRYPYRGISVRFPVPNLRHN